MPTARGQTVTGFWLPCQGAETTIIFSHGNATDAAPMLRFHALLGQFCHVNCFSYDYAGYGASTGAPSVPDTIADLGAAVETVRRLTGRGDESIVLFGQSVGGGVPWAARMPALGGVVQSTFASGLRVVFGPGDAWRAAACPCVFAPFDPYRNVRALRRVNAPVLVMHGEDDEVVEFGTGRPCTRRLRGGPRRSTASPWRRTLCRGPGTTTRGDGSRGVL